jgi:hypothetical protein
VICTGSVSYLFADWESTEKRLMDTQCKKKLHSNLTALAKILEKQVIYSFVVVDCLIFA